jgi:hypothetical protein
MVAERLNLRVWLQRVLGWDGLLPLANAFVAATIRFVIPKHEQLAVAVVTGLPLATLFLRAHMGNRHINSNHCSEAVRVFQHWVLAVGILLLFFVDVLLITQALLPQGLALLKNDDWISLGCVFAAYLILMTLAMYPGRRITRPSSSSYPVTGESG